MVKRKHIKALPIIAKSGFNPKPGSINTAKKHHYYIVTNIAITGDAPKNFIRFYKYGISRKSNTKSWPLYIAKHGHKHYPMETITERLLNQIGEVAGFNIAESELAWLGGQIQFLSKYFLSKPHLQILEHGADLYAGYLNDRDFVEEIENQNKAPDFFTVQFTESTIKHFFPENYPELMRDFLKLLIFDALIGNNDRHFYNWGIIRNVLGKERPYFSPIFDTARGLFWNFHETKIKEIYNNKNRRHSFIIKYAESSTPKIGWEGIKKINHFQLIEKIESLSYIKNERFISGLCSDNTLKKVFIMLDNEYCHLLSYERKQLIKEYLHYRHHRIRKIFNFVP